MPSGTGMTMACPMASIVRGLVAAGEPAEHAASTIVVAAPIRMRLEPGTRLGRLENAAAGVTGDLPLHRLQSTRDSADTPFHSQSGARPGERASRACWR